MYFKILPVMLAVCLMLSLTIMLKIMLAIIGGSLIRGCKCYIIYIIIIYSSIKYYKTHTYLNRYLHSNMVEQRRNRIT